MSTLLWLSLILAIGVSVYLLVALLAAERF